MASRWPAHESMTGAFLHALQAMQEGSDSLDRDSVDSQGRPRASQAKQAMFSKVILVSRPYA